MSIPHCHVVATFPDVGGADEIWFNPGDGRAYFPIPGAPGPDASLGVLDVANRKSLGLTTVIGLRGAHSIAAAAHGNRIFIPSNDSPATPGKPDSGGGGIAIIHVALSTHGGDD